MRSKIALATAEGKAAASNELEGLASSSAENSSSNPSWFEASSERSDCFFIHSPFEHYGTGRYYTRELARPLSGILGMCGRRCPLTTCWAPGDIGEPNRDFFVRLAG